MEQGTRHKASPDMRSHGVMVEWVGDVKGSPRHFGPHDDRKCVAADFSIRLFALRRRRHVVTCGQHDFYQKSNALL